MYSLTYSNQHETNTILFIFYTQDNKAERNPASEQDGIDTNRSQGPIHCDHGVHSLLQDSFKFNFTRNHKGTLVILQLS